jgi:hypothetical protein
MDSREVVAPLLGPNTLLRFTARHVLQHVRRLSSHADRMHGQRGDVEAQHVQMVEAPLQVKAGGAPEEIPAKFPGAW